MYILFELGINENEIINMIEQVPEIKDLEDIEIERKIYLLKQIGCLDKHIRNILIANPYYLDSFNEDIISLIKTLNKYRFNNIYLLLDSNPFILNLESFEIEDYINNKLKNNYELEDIINELESNPYLFNEM